MPKLGDKHYAYTKAGIEAFKKAKKKKVMKRGKK